MMPPHMQPEFKQYSEPESGKTSTLKIYNSTEYGATLWIFKERAKCKEPHYTAVPPHQSKIIRIPANEAKLFSIFYSDTVWRTTTSCSISITYKPIEDHAYTFIFSKDKKGCTLAALDDKGNAIDAERITVKQPFIQPRDTGEWCD
jgi:hypothetical protein